MRTRLTALGLAAVVLGLLVAPVTAATEPDPEPEITAYVDGRPIPVSDIPRYYCDDFAYPVISCTRLPHVAQNRALTAALVAEVEYVTVYDWSGYGGTYMHMSQDYAMLASVGWNDRVSSFRGRNSETGRFNGDWFHTGTTWLFCCNVQVFSLGSYDNTFSSVKRT